jgi:anti-sigma regulatory factor (Ser/Thr protein kinase)
MSIMGSEKSSHIRREGTTAGSGAPDSLIQTRHANGMETVAHQSSDVRLTLPARPENVAVVRHVLGAFGDAMHLPESVVEDMRLAVTEACTNVVRHAYDDEPGPIEIVIRPRGETLEVIVSDNGRGIGPSPDTKGPGLGLPLIAALAHSLEIQHAPRAGSRLAMSFLRRPGVEVA